MTNTVDQFGVPLLPAIELPGEAPAASRLNQTRVNEVIKSLEDNHTAIPELIIVLPAYNESEALVSTAWELEQVLSDYTFRILIVNDGSTDNSIDLVERANLPNTQIVHHPENRGLGGAIKTGLKLACKQARQDGDIVIVMDSDFTHTPYLIDQMVRTVRAGNDIVIASRYRYGAQVIGLEPYREFLSNGASWLFRMLIPIRNVKDYTCGYRAYRVSLLRKAFAKYGDQLITETGFACMAELLIKLARFGAIICEVPMVLRYDKKRSTSKMNVVKTIVKSLKMLTRFMLIR